MQRELVKNNVPGLPVRISTAYLPTKELVVAPIHIHDDIEILAGECGILNVEIDGEHIKLGKGDIIVINSRVPHSTYTSVEMTSYILLQFRIEKLRSGEFEKINKYLSLVLAKSETKYVFLKADDPVTFEIFGILQKIRQENSDGKPNYDIFIKGYMEVLLGLLYRHNILVNIEDGYDKDAVGRIWPVIEYIDKNYQEKLTLDKLSGILNLNREYFCRIFKEASGVTPVDYINFVRVMKAETMLTSTNLSITEISMDAGFASVSYFNRIFKKQRGVTPSAYKKIVYAKNRLL